MRVKTFRGKNYIQFDEEELAAKYPEFYQDYLNGDDKRCQSLIGCTSVVKSLRSDYISYT